MEIDTIFVLYLIYRLPNSTDQHNSSLLSYLNSLDYSKNIIIIGDMNLPDVNWNTYSGCSMTSLSEEFKDLVLPSLLVVPLTVLETPWT